MTAEMPDPGSQWSGGLDILSPGMSTCEVPTAVPGVAAVVAAHVSRSSSGWSVLFLPGCSVHNHSAQKLLLAHSSRLPGSSLQVCFPPVRLGGVERLHQHRKPNLMIATSCSAHDDG